MASGSAKWITSNSSDAVPCKSTHKTSKDWAPYQELIVEMRGQGKVAAQIQKALTDRGFQVGIDAVKKRLRRLAPKNDMPSTGRKRRLTTANQVTLNGTPSLSRVTPYLEGRLTVPLRRMVDDPMGRATLQSLQLSIGSGSEIFSERDFLGPPISDREGFGGVPRKRIRIDRAVNTPRDSLFTVTLDVSKPITMVDLEKFAGWVMQLFNIPLDFQYGRSRASSRDSIMASPGTLRAENGSPRLNSPIRCFEVSKQPAPAVSEYCGISSTSGVEELTEDVSATGTASGGAQTELDEFLKHTPDALTLVQEAGRKSRVYVREGHVHEADDANADQDSEYPFYDADVTGLILPQTDEDLEYAKFQYRQGYFYFTDDDSTALVYLDSCLEVLNRILPVEHVWKLRVHLLRARALHFLDRLDEAELTCTSVCEGFVKELGPGNWETRDAYSHLILILYTSGKYPKAAEAAQKAVHLGLRSGIEYDAATFNTLYYMGRVHGVQGENSQAMESSEVMVRYSVCRYGYRHHRTALAIREYGRGLIGLGLHRDAILALKTALKMKQAITGSTQDASSCEGDIHYQLGRAYHALGLLKESERQFSLMVSSAGGRQPKQLSSMLNGVYWLGIVNAAQGNLDSAIRHHERALLGRRRILGEHHPYILSSIGAIVNILNDRGLVLYAKPLSYYVLKGNERAYGPLHREVLNWIIQLADLTLKSAGLEIAEV